MSAKLCLIEDEESISDLVSKKLRAAGYEVRCFDSAEAFLGNTDQESDLYIVDRLLPGMNGLDLCQRLRKNLPRTPLLILSALSEPQHRIEGLKEGADDYLGKPFEMEELLLRVSGMLKRKAWYEELPEAQSKVQFGNNEINFLNFEARHGEKIFFLSQKECMLMKLLIEKQDAVVTRNEILDRVWGYHVFPSTRTVDNFIVRLRKYFEQDPEKPTFIHSIRGMGYTFTKKEPL